jgi:dGTPase
LEDWIARRSQARTSTRTRFNAGTIESHFQRDRARVIHSAWFRALQSKTQVLGLGESDFYRTRLTHSLEVAQIGSGIVEHVRGENARNPLTKDMAEWIAPLSLIDAACLAHDIGHSPFGHGGEVALNYMMRNDGGFEANGQTLRILSRLGEYSEDSGLDLTRRSTLSVIKYPGFCTELAQYHSTSEAQANTPGANGHSFNHALNIDHWHPPKGIYEDEREVLDWVLEPFSADDRKRFRHVEPQNNGHAKTVYKSLDTSIMELADDIAYGVHDLEDAVAMSLLSPSQWQQHFLQPLAEIENNPILSKQDFYSENLFSGTNKKRKHAISKLVGYLIDHIEIQEDTDFEHPLLRMQAVMDPNAAALLKLLKKFVMEQVILRPELQALQYRGQRVILTVFDICQHNMQRLLPPAVFEETKNSDNPKRELCDYIAGLTDASATRLYNRLTTPSTGSIFDRG